MRYEIIFSTDAADDFKALNAGERSSIRKAVETHLQHEPRKISRSRIKKLRGIDRPQFRLRVGEYRVFYDVAESAVEILAIVAKSEVESWLVKFGSNA